MSYRVSVGQKGHKKRPMRFSAEVRRLFIGRGQSKEKRDQSVGAVWNRRLRFRLLFQEKIDTLLENFDVIGENIDKRRTKILASFLFGG